MDSPTVEFELAGDQKITDQQVFQTLAEQGFNPTAVSPDGQMVTMQDGQGEYQTPMSAVLNNLGMGQMVGMKPLDADYSSADPMWRALVHKLPNDNDRRAVLQQILQQRGVQNPTIVGSGRDWHVFNPEGNYWVGLTNNPEWDATDLVEAGLEAPRFVASGLAGGAAAAGTGGNPFAGMAGAAAGGGAVDAMERGALAFFSPEYRQHLSQNPGATAADIAKGMAFDAAGMGIGKLAGKALGRATGGMATEAAPLSALARGGGTAGRVGGELTETMAGALDGPVMSDLATSFVPGAAEAQGLGYLMEAPAWLARNSAKGIDKLGGAVEGALPRVGQGLKNVAGRMTQPRGNIPAGDTRNVVGNVMEGGMARARSAMGHGPHAEEMYDYWRRASVAARKAGASPNEARAAGDRAAQEFEGRFMRGSDPATRAAGNAGEKLGEYMNLAEEGGRNLGRVAVGGVRLGLKGVKTAGGLARRGGAAAESIGRRTVPIEASAYGRLGAERALEPAMSYAEEQWAPWYPRENQSKMRSTLAGL